MKIDVNMLIEWDDFQVDEAGRTLQLNADRSADLLRERN